MRLRILPRALLAATVLSSLAAVPASSRPSLSLPAAPPAPVTVAALPRVIPSYAVPAGAPVPDRCGPGLTAMQFSFGVTCTHGGDPHLHAAPTSSSKEARKGPVATPKCYGNGENGSRVQLIYVYLVGTPNRASKFVPQILKTYVPHIEGMFRQTSKQQGREIGVRFWAPGCLLSVDVIPIPYRLGNAKEAGGVGKQTSNVVQFLYDNGYDDSNKKYLVWLDASSGGGVCGVGLSIPDDSPPALNYNNGNPGVGLVPASFFGLPPLFALVFGPGCWGTGGPGSPISHTEIHELLHTLGAVARSSPNSNGVGHCTDSFDIMCYPDPFAEPELRVMKQRCAYATPALDCGSDDYFAINPAPDSYLATHMNVAYSQFLADAPVDLAPVVLPRQ